MKDDIRRQLKTERASFGGERKKAADKAAAEIFLNNFKNYESFFIYNSLPAEADTKHIISSLLSSGKKVCIPRVEGKDIVAVPYSDLTKSGAFGICEPLGLPYTGEIDVTVIPLLCVNEKLFRIGYGGGYYDRYLSDKRTVKVGLGYKFQMAEFKSDEWDVPLDYFVCEEGIYGK